MNNNYSFKNQLFTVKSCKHGVRLQAGGLPKKRLCVNVYYPVNSINTGMIKPGKSHTINIVNSFNTIVTSYFPSNTFPGPF